MTIPTIGSWALDTKQTNIRVFFNFGTLLAKISLVKNMSWKMEFFFLKIKKSYSNSFILSIHWQLGHEIPALYTYVRGAFLSDKEVYKTFYFFRENFLFLIPPSKILFFCKIIENVITFDAFPHEKTATANN